MADLRYAFSRNGGNLGEAGSVSFLFEDAGIIVIHLCDLDEEELMLEAIEAGALEFEVEEHTALITTAYGDLQDVKKALVDAGYTIEASELTKIPTVTTQLNPEQEETMVKLIDKLEDNDDVQNVYHNAELS